LVEDQKRLQLDLAAFEPGKSGAGADGKDMIASVDEAGAQLFGRGRRLHLLHYVAALVGQLDYELCHRSGCQPGAARPASLSPRL